jgi:hypothetical protein
MNKIALLYSLLLSFPTLAQIDGFFGEYRLRQNTSGNCHDAIEVIGKIATTDCKDVALKFVGLPRGSGKWIHAVCNFNLGEHTIVEENPMTGEKIDRIITNTLLTGQKIVSISVRKGAKFYDKNKVYSTLRFTFEMLPSGVYSLSLFDNRPGAGAQNFSCLYDKH